MNILTRLVALRNDLLNMSPHEVTCCLNEIILGINSVSSDDIADRIMKDLFPKGSTMDRSITSEYGWDDMRNVIKKTIDTLGDK